VSEDRDFEMEDPFDNDLKIAKKFTAEDLEHLERYCRVMNHYHDTMMRREQLMMMAHYRRLITSYNDMVAAQYGLKLPKTAVAKAYVQYK
jgi:hypothetical protein